MCHGKCRHAKGFVFEFVDEQLRAAAELRKQKIYSHKKPVRCIEKNITYPSINDASRQTGIAKEHIGNVCRGNKRTTGGYHWEFVQ